MENESRDLKIVSDVSQQFMTRSQAEEANFDFAKMRVGLKTIDDAILKLTTFEKVNPNFGNKTFVLQAIDRHEHETLREISNYFYETSGIYKRACQLLAYLYRYDWYVTPILKKDKVNKNKVLTGFYSVLDYLDNSDIKKLFGRIALEVMKSGAFYGYGIDLGDRFTIQQLPTNYCRSRWSSGLDPVIELNMAFFKEYFSNEQYRIRVLSMFPKEIQKAYILYQEGKLQGDFPGDPAGWYALDPKLTIKFSMGDSDCPFLVDAIPSIIDLDQAQELDRKKMMQQLLKVIIQKLPLDKNGNLIFDVDEAKDIHNNAVAMLKRAVGVDVLTTFADIDVADMQDKNSTTTSDELQKVERTVYNNLGISQNLFNTDGNIALQKSILNDEASVKDLLYQFQGFLNKIIARFNAKNSANFIYRCSILETTIYNYIDLAKLYKEHTQIGYSKMLPQIALGHSQSSILSTLRFENDVLSLAEMMIPPMSSNTMSSKNLGNNDKSENKNSQNNQNKSDDKGGRPQKQEGDKSEKTLQNQEALN